MNLRHLILICSLSVSFCACNKVTDQVPVSDLTKDNFWKSQADAEAGLTAVYNQLQSIASIRLSTMSLRSDEAVTPDVYGWNIQNPGIHDFQNNIVSPSDGNASWSAFYTGIARANDVLAYVPNITFADADKNRVLGEALFLRSYFYFVLALGWGDVPIIIKPYTVVSNEMKVSRDPVDKVYQQIIDDLKTAESLLPDQQPNAKKNIIRATKAAAQSLLCEVYLTRGYKSYSVADDFQNAANEAQAVISSNYYHLEDGASYGNIFSKGGSKEVILEVSYDYTLNAVNGLSNQFLPRAYSENRGFGGDANVLPTKLITDDHEPGDLRTSTNFSVVPSPAVYYDHELAGMPYVNKYPGTIVTQGVIRYGDSPWILYRLSDIILMKAEALIKLHQLNDAKDLLDQVRNRAGLGGTTAASEDDVFRAIIKERLYELCFEGKRWNDLVRTGLVSEVKPAFVDKILVPVPQTDIDRDPNLLPQNPGY
ncbi:MAG TPA: RagB/SusD family nutrient uptake outer membrane protein [Puia sp.]